MSAQANLRPAGATEAPEMADRQRVRVIYEKGGSIKFISHQDEFRAWERALRRSGLPLLYKQGFNPQPHMQFASPLGVGFSGAQEIVDITFSPHVALEELERRISQSLPPGLKLKSITEVDLRGPARQTLLIGADYTLEILADNVTLPRQEIQDRITTFLHTEVCVRARERKGKRYEYNLRPLVYELRYLGFDAESVHHRIFLRVQQREGATGRPDEVVAAVGLDNYARNLRRERLYFSDVESDAATFAEYTVAQKAEIAVSQHAVATDGPGGGRRQKRRKKGRSLGERASDEFT